MTDLTSRAQEYLRILNGETILMNWHDATEAAEDLFDVGLARYEGLVVVITDKGRVLAKQLKRDANGRMP